MTRAVYQSTQNAHSIREKGSKINKSWTATEREESLRDEKDSLSRFFQSTGKDVVYCLDGDDRLSLRCM